MDTCAATKRDANVDYYPSIGDNQVKRCGSGMVGSLGAETQFNTESCSLLNVDTIVYTGVTTCHAFSFSLLESIMHTSIHTNILNV